MRGKVKDEKISERYSITSSKARSTEEASSSSETADIQMSSPVDDDNNCAMDLIALIISFMRTFIHFFISIIKDLQAKLLTSVPLADNLNKEIKALKSNVFNYKNLSCRDIKAYTNLDKKIFDVLCEYLRSIHG